MFVDDSRCAACLSRAEDTLSLDSGLTRWYRLWSESIFRVLPCYFGYVFITKCRLFVKGEILGFNAFGSIWRGSIGGILI